MSKNSKDDIDSFLQAIKGVRPLQQDRVNLFEQKPKSRLHISKADKGLNPQHSLQSISDEIPEQTADSWFHHGLQKKMQRKIRMGQLAIDDVLDLHGSRLQQAQRELDQFVQQALQQRAKMLLIIHGQGYRSQGTAVLRPMVQHWLSQQTMVLAYCPAQIRDGGIGASYVYLKNLS